jgi:hypothetical protein
LSFGFEGGVKNLLVDEPGSRADAECSRDITFVYLLVNPFNRAVKHLGKFADRIERTLGHSDLLNPPILLSPKFAQKTSLIEMTDFKPTNQKKKGEFMKRDYQQERKERQEMVYQYFRYLDARTFWDREIKKMRDKLKALKLLDNRNRLIKTNLHK